MACGEIHQNDIGTAFNVTISDCDSAVNISTATVRDIIWLKPSGTKVTKNLVPFLTDGTDGIIQYISIVDDLDEIGPWSIQAMVTLPTGTWYSEIQQFNVAPNL